MNTEIKKLHQQLIKTHKELSLHLGKTYDAGEADAILREMNEVNFRAMMAGRLIFKETTENIDKKIAAVMESGADLDQAIGSIDELKDLIKKVGQFLALAEKA